MNAFEKLFSALIEEAAAEAEKRVLEKLQHTAVPDKVLNIKEASEYLGISEKLIYQMCSEGALPHIRAGGLHSTKPRILFRQTTLDRWLREQEEASIQKEVNTAYAATGKFRR